MDETGGVNHPMLYSLCAVAAGAAILNAVFLLWQALKLHRPKGFAFVKHSLLLLNAFYSLTGLALVLLVLYRDAGGSSLCDAGGYLILVGSQLALWFQATSCISLLVWIRKSISPDIQRRNGPIFALIACAQCLVIATISALPYMNLPYFDNTGGFYFTCTPLKLPGEKGWAYSTLLLILDWISVVIGAGALIKISIHCSSCRQPSIPAAEKLEEFYTDGSKLRQQRQSFLTLTVCLAGWIAVLVIANITYFSSGKLDQDAAQWILGFCLSITLCLRPVFNLGHQLISRWLTRNGHGLKTYSSSLFQSRPSGLQRLARLPDSHQNPHVQKYLVQWRDKKSGHLLSGTMKTFVPTAQNLWRSEVNALEKLGQEGHPNLASYLWVSPNNPFTQSICSSTGDPVSRHAGVICRMHFPNGTLADFLRTRIQQLSERSLHKIASDVANGLEYLHHRNLVHNGLNSNAVFMASISEKSGMKAVIGDLESSYSVSDDDQTPGHLYKNKATWGECDTTELFTITSRMALQQDSSQNKFAPDIRAFGLLVLEMLVAISQYKQKIQSAPRSRVSRLLEEVVRDATENEHPVDTSTPHDYHLHDDENCLCSNRVVDVRVHNGEAIHQTSEELVHEWKLTPEGEIERQQISTCDDFEESSLIPRETNTRGENILLNSAQNDGAEMCLSCGHTLESTENRQVHPCLDSPASQGTDNLGEEDLCPSCQCKEVNGLKLQERGSNTPPKLSVRAFSVDKTNTLIKPRVQGQQFVGDHVIELPEIGESDTESVASIYRPYARRGSHTGKQILTNGSFLTPRTTPELRTPTSRSDSSTGTPTHDMKSPGLSLNENSSIETSETKVTLKDVEGRQDTPLSIKVQEIGFQTIYEEDENQNNTLPTKTKPHIPPKPRKLFKPPVPIKRRPPPPLPRNDSSIPGQTEANGKRFSMASLDESVISAADSGLGSSHYESSYCGSEISSIYLQPGSRNTIYSGSMTEGSEMYCPVKLDQKSRVMDSGIESSADSCDELNARRIQHRNGHFQQDSDPTTYTSEGSSNTNTDNHDTNENDEDSVNNTYEQLPDSPAVLPRRKEKQPCVGHHEHLENSPCKHTPSVPKTSATISTQTTDSLERPKGDRRKSGDSAAEDFRFSVNKSGILEESDSHGTSDEQLNQDNCTQHNFSQTTYHSQSVQPHTVRQKTRVHQETVHSQPVHTQTAIYPQKLQPPHLPPKQIYTQSPPQHHYYEIGPNSDSVPYSKHNVSTFENLYSEHRRFGDHYNDFGSMPRTRDCYRKDISEVHGTYSEHDDNTYGKIDRRSSDLYKQSSLETHSVRPQVAGSYPTPWSDYRHNLAYYKSDLKNFEAKVPETHRSAFRKPTSSDLKYSNYLSERSAEIHGSGHHQTDEEKLSNVLDKLKKEGRLGLVAGQLMPLLTECYSKDPAPSTDDILHKLEQVLPSATV